MILYRPVGLQELELIYDSGMRAFPARLPQQPIFYPVLQLEYARQIASDWNAKSGQSAGYVTQLKVEESYISQFEPHTVGSSQHQEFWIPAEELEEFNKHITGHIKVLEAHFGDAFQGFVPDKFGLAGKNVVEQFTVLTNSYIYKRMDFYLEIKRNHKAVFLNYPFWQKHDFKNPALKEKILKAIREAWLTSFPKTPLADPVQEDSTLVKDTDSQAFMDPHPEDSTPIRKTDSRILADPVDEKPTPLEQADAHAYSWVDPVPDDAPRKQIDSDSVVSPVHEHHALVKQTASHFSQGLELGLSGKYHEAIGELSRAVEEDPDHVVAHTSLGVAFHRAGEDDRALACYEAALEIDPSHAEAHYFRANILYSAGDVREALAGYSRAIGLIPGLIEAHQAPAPQDRLTDYTRSPAEMHRIAKPAYRILDLNKSLATHPRQASLFKERAGEYYRLGNYEQAIADYSSSLAIQPDDAGALHLRAVAYERLGQHDRALEDYQRAIASDPQLSNVYINRGVAFGNMGNFRQSIASFTEAIRLAPQNPDGYFNRGTAYLQQGDLERAIEDFSHVIQLSPGDEGAYYWRGISNEETGRPGEAIADYRQFLALSRDENARREIEQRLSQWKERERNGPGTARHYSPRSEAEREGRGGLKQRVIPEDRKKTDQVLSAKPDQESDLYGLITALGERALRSTWFGSGVDCYGENAEELYALTDQNRPIEGHDFLRIASGIRQTLEGDFHAFDPGATSHWIFLRAWDGSGFYIETDDPQIEKQLKAHFQALEEVEGANPPYKSLFIRI